jgi:glycosyltransferase involved in cell wall biosynthesis
MGLYARAFIRSEPLPRRAAGFALHVGLAVARRGVRLVGPRVVESARRVVDGPDLDPEVVERVLGVAPTGGISPVPNRVVSVIGSLAPGGAERQLAIYLSEASGRGLAEHRLVTLNRCDGVHAHHLGRVESAGVAVRAMGAEADPRVLREIRSNRALRLRLRSVPAVLRPNVSDLVGEFLRESPSVVHAWLDHANIVAGIAALAVGVPRVVLSLRSLHPGHFPMLHRGWMRAWYRALAASPRVRFVANSREGAASYAEWIGIEPARIAVVLNGMDSADAMRAPPSEVARVKAELAPDGARVVSGVMRLSEEKRPNLFAEVARRVCAERPDVRFAIAGDGPLAGELRAAAAPLGERLAVLGRRTDVPAILAASQVVLLTSRVEGTPNVLLEAQMLGTPVVATRVGGVPDVVEDGVTGLLADRDDAAALARAVLALLDDEDVRARMGAAGARMIAERFSIHAMVAGNDRLYRP